MPDWSHLRADELYYAEAAREWSQGGICQPFHMSPLFITSLSMLRRLFGESPLAWRIPLLCLGLFSSLLLYGVARRRLGERAALWAMGLYLFCGPLLFYESNLDLSTVASTLMLAALYCATRWQDADPQRPWDGIGYWLGAGACVGLGITARPNAALLLLPLGLAPLWLRLHLSLGRRLCLSVAAPALALLVTLPVTLHNLRCDDRLVWITDTGGLNFYIGNHRDASGTFNVPPRVPAATDVVSQDKAFVKAAQRELGHPVSRAEASVYWRDQALKDIAAAPLRWVRLLLFKLLLVFHEKDIANTRNYAFRVELMKSMGPWLVQTGYLTPLAVLGLLLWLRRARDFFFPLSFALCYVGALTLLFVLGHYRQVLLPLFILASVTAGQELLRLWRAGARRAVLGGLAAVAVLALLFNVDLRRGDPTLERSDEAFKHGYALEVAGNSAAAERWYLEALVVQPRHRLILERLALLYSHQGRAAEAIPLWQAAQQEARTAHDSTLIREAEGFLQALTRQGAGPR